MWDIGVEFVRYRKVDLHYDGRNALNDTVVSFVHQRCSNVSANVSGKRSRSVMGHILPRTGHLVQAVAVDPIVGAAASSIDQPRQSRHPLPGKRTSQTQH